MYVEPEYETELSEYIEPLRLLEQSFIAAGLNIEFYLRYDNAVGKFIVIDYNCHGHIRCIEGDNPAQAVKDIAEVVRL
jgi:hypothetical protein